MEGDVLLSLIEKAEHACMAVTLTSRPQKGNYDPTTLHTSHNRRDTHNIYCCCKPILAYTLAPSTCSQKTLRGNYCCTACACAAVYPCGGMICGAGAMPPRMPSAPRQRRQGRFGSRSAKGTAVCHRHKKGELHHHHHHHHRLIGVILREAGLRGEKLTTVAAHSPARDAGCTPSYQYTQ